MSQLELFESAGVDLPEVRRPRRRRPRFRGVDEAAFRAAWIAYLRAMDAYSDPKRAANDPRPDRSRR